MSSNALVQLVDQIHREIKDIRGAGVGRTREEIDEMTKPADPDAILDAIKQKKP